MSDLPMISDESIDANDTPLPLIVAKRWNFSLAHHATLDGTYYAVQDWMRGLLGEADKIRTLLHHYRKEKAHLNSLMKMFPYKTRNDKVQKRPFIKEEGLMSLLIGARLGPGRHQLVEIRNFLAESYMQYQYLRCSPVQDKQPTEYEFQSALVLALRSLWTNFDLFQYYATGFGRKVDVMISRTQVANSYSTSTWLIECKITSQEFYKAIGQLTCYRAELLQTVTSNTQLAIAMPIELIDNYMRHIAAQINIHLISVVNGVVINAITGEALSADAF